MDGGMGDKTTPGEPTSEPESGTGEFFLSLQLGNVWLIAFTVSRKMHK
jgi:hypothetical protein